MIWDSFLFFNETELLDIRLHELAPVVDGFILVEATHTHQGKPKPMYFEPERYKEYNIQHLILETPYTDKPTLEQMRQNEIVQRNMIVEALRDKQQDLIIVSDVDEIPSREAIAEIKDFHRVRLPIKIQHESLYYYLNLKGEPIFNNPYGAVVATVADTLRVRPQAFRQCLYDPEMPSMTGGWHIRFLGDEKTKQKLESVFPDKEYAKVRKNLKMFDRFDGPYPHLVTEQPKRFKGMFVG